MEGSPGANDCRPASVPSGGEEIAGLTQARREALSKGCRHGSTAPGRVAPAPEAQARRPLCEWLVIVSGTTPA